MTDDQLANMVIDGLMIDLEQRRIRSLNESLMQADVMAMLNEDSAIGWTDEHRLDASNRIDFWCETYGVGIECKVKGTYAAVLSQLLRYLDFPEVNGVLLVTKCSAHLAMPDTGRGKPLRVHWTSRNAI